MAEAIATEFGGEAFRTSAETDQIFAALVAAQKELRGVEKTGQNTFQHYDYAKLEDFVRASRPILFKHGLALTTSLCGFKQLPDIVIKGNGQEKSHVHMAVKLAIRILHQSGQWIEAYSLGEGADQGDKATYKAITGSRKYGIAAALNLATTDDPEADEGYFRQVAVMEEPPMERLKAAFAGVGVGEERLAKWLGHSLASVSSGELDKLRAVFGAIRAGVAKVEDYFPTEDLSAITAGTPPTEARATVDSSPQPKKMSKRAA